MTRLHLFLLFLGGVFAVLWLAFPRRRALAWIYLRYVVLALAAAVVLTPFAWLVCAAFKSTDALMAHTFLPPVHQWTAANLNLGNFRELFTPETTPQGAVCFWRYVVNSLFLACAGTVIQVFFASLAGFAMAKYDVPGRRALVLFMLGSMMVPGMVFLAPVYALITTIGWMDSYLALLVPGAVPVFGVILFRQAMQAVPNELIEAARIDGAGEFGIYWNLAMPLVRPMTGAFCLVSFLGSWNSFIGPQVFVHTQSKLTLPVMLNHYIGVYSQQYGVFLAGTLLAIIPPAIIFFALQREFVSGLTAGAVKG